MAAGVKSAADVVMVLALCLALIVLLIAIVVLGRTA